MLRVCAKLLLLATAVFLCGTVLVRAEVIETDTVWSGDVLITGKVLVDKTATLLIMPGSRLRFSPIPAGSEKGGGRLIVSGRLIAQGTAESPILFTSAAVSPQSGDWEGLRFEKAGSLVNRLDFCIIEYARAGINGRSSSLQVATTQFRNNQTGVSARSGFIGSLFDCLFTANLVGVRFEQNNQMRVVNSRIDKNQNSGIICSNSSPIVQNSLITSNGADGIACLRSSSPLIDNNLISGHERGVQAEMNSSPTIQYNEISNNDTAISLERLSVAIIEQNLIRRNRIGLYLNLGSYPHFHRNNVSDNRDFAVDLGPNQSIVVARTMPFERRVEMNMPLPGKAQGVPTSELEVVAAFPRDGLIDAYGNWWGHKSLRELKSGESNLNFFEDGFDKADLIFQDKSYPRDRIGYAGWSEQPIEQAGRRSVAYSGVEGLVVLDGMPVIGARVHAYRDGETKFADEGLTFSAPTGADGGFSLFLKPGSYHLIAMDQVSSSIARSPGEDVIRGSATVYPVTVEAEAFVKVRLALQRGENALQAEISMNSFKTRN